MRPVFFAEQEKIHRFSGTRYFIRPGKALLSQASAFVQPGSRGIKYHAVYGNGKRKVESVYIFPATPTHYRPAQFGHRSEIAVDDLKGRSVIERQNTGPETRRYPQFKIVPFGLLA